MLDDLDLEIDLGPIADLLSHVADAVGNALDSDVVDTVSDVVLDLADSRRRGSGGRYIK
jgi:hypothetical protein